MQEQISFNQIIEMLRKRIKIIILFMFLGVAISASLTFFFITPKFSSQAQLVVTLPQTENTNVNEVTSNLQMINTYKDFIVSDLVLNQVEDRLKSDYNMMLSIGELKKSISVQQNQNSQMFSIIAKSTRANQAMYIANTVASIFQENAKDVLNVDRITIISKATVNIKPVSPNNKLNVMIGLVAGIIIGTGIALLFGLLDRTVKDSTFITEELGFTILGIVPELSEKDVEKYIKEAKKINSSKVKNEELNSLSNTQSSEKQNRRRRSRV